MMPPRIVPLLLVVLALGACRAADPVTPEPPPLASPAPAEPSPPAGLLRARGAVVALDTTQSASTRLLVQAEPPGAWSGRIWLLVDARTTVLPPPGRPSSPRAVAPGAIVRAVITTGILLSDPAAALADTLVIEAAPTP